MLSRGRTIGLLRQGPMQSAASLRFRLGDDAPAVRGQIAQDLSRAMSMARSYVIGVEAVYVGVR